LLKSIIKAIGVGKERNSMNSNCNLLPYHREEVFSLQELKQSHGWEITSFNIPEVWKLAQGEGVKVAVLDTGCDLTHDDLKNNLLQGKNFVNKKQDPVDSNGHGTHVSGIVAAENNSHGMVGVAPKAKIIPVKALADNGNGNSTNVAEAIAWSADQGADFIVMSLGSPSPISDVHKSIKYAVKKGCIIFCAAGNAGKTRQIFYPANYPETIGIGSIDENFERAGFSCTGDDLDFLAPGVKIFSTIPVNWYAYMSGTSMSTPYVVGCAALLLSYSRKNKDIIKLKSADDYKIIFRKHAVSLKNPEFGGKKFFEGFGIIDPRKFQEWIKN
jgi:subtilisin family serine protease